MRKKAVMVAVSLALVSSIALAHAAFAVPPDGRLDPKGSGNQPTATNAQREEDEAEGQADKARGSGASGSETVKTCDGQSPGARLERSGYDWETYGENIAWGSGSYGTPEGTFERWMKSPGHRKNILEEDFREVGVGLAGVKDEERSAFYTVDFGTRRR